MVLDERITLDDAELCFKQFHHMHKNSNKASTLNSRLAPAPVWGQTALITHLSGRAVLNRYEFANIMPPRNNFVT